MSHHLTMHTQRLPEKYKKFTKVNEFGLVEWNLEHFDVNTSVLFGGYHVEMGTLKETDSNKCEKIRDDADISTGIYCVDDFKYVYRLCLKITHPCERTNNYIVSDPSFVYQYKYKLTDNHVDDPYIKYPMTLHNHKNLTQINSMEAFLVSHSKAMYDIEEYTLATSDRRAWAVFAKTIERIDDYHPKFIAINLKDGDDCSACGDNHEDGECWCARYISQIFTKFYFKKYSIIQHIGLPNDLPADISGLLLSTFMDVCWNYNYTNNTLINL